jgi:hypothetical protein
MDFRPLALISDIVHTPHALVVMANLYHCQPIDDIDEDHDAVEEAVAKLQQLGIVSTDVACDLTPAGRAVQEAFESLERPST